jgi:NAD-dependent deacetylase
MDVEQLAELVRRRGPCVVLTGAGISTESGIPDFRSPFGVWARYDPSEVASIDGFFRDPEHVWEFYGLRIDALSRAEPNEGHRALVELEDAGLVRAVITQNVDRLHARAGSRALVEVHGSIGSAVCLACGEVVLLAQLVELLPLPHCPRCDAILKPGVVMFGETLPPDAIARATQLARAAGVLLAVGSTLEVYPAAGLPLETLAAGGSFAIVNRGQTGLDDRAELKLDAGAGETLRALTDALLA